MIKVHMARIRPTQRATLTADSLHFMSPEIIEDGKEVTLNRQLDPYRPSIPTGDDEGDSEPPHLIPTSDLREPLTTVKLYIQQQWDLGVLSLAFELVDESAC